MGEDLEELWGTVGRYGCPRYSSMSFTCLGGGKDALGRFVAKLFECREEATELFSVGGAHR